MSAPTGASNAYQILGVHPSAPGELIAAVYWMVVGELQNQRSAGARVDAELHAVTRAYEMIADPVHRDRYDAAIGHHSESVLTRPIRAPRRSLRSRLLHRPQPALNIDYYEIIGLDPNAPASLAHEAHRIMRDVYLRAPDRRKRQLLVRLLDEALVIVMKPDLRNRYDGKRGKTASRAHTTESDAPIPPVQHATTAPVSEPLTASQPPSQQESAELEMAPPAIDATATDSPVEPSSLVATPAVVAPDRPAPAPEPPSPIHSPDGVSEPALEIAPDMDTPDRDDTQDTPKRSALRAVAGVAGSTASGVGRAAAAAAKGLGASVRAVGSQLSRLRANRQRGMSDDFQPPAPPARSPNTQQPPSPRRSKDLEEAFLGRLASSVEQTRKAHSDQADPES